ncbi:hypothetical protein MKW98_009629 [Papaver atlanticum]|uniref:Uncharacterized protein n=1 Tax=Papaver atlanticum TaxID=357466 RepID=A0AAD4SDN5_9MAGN|nr:hypothetical protein MKW98_009629 [Papaver atlanticum]
MQTRYPIQKSHDGEEKFLKDIQFGSIDWSTLRLPASCHETEEDSLSTTSTIDYDFEYTDEECPKEDEDDEDDERPTDEEVTKMMSYLESQLGVSHRESGNEWPDKDAWVASWKEVYTLSRWTWISVYAYFQKGLGYGGYGVILRNAVAKPIIASAKFSKDGKSFFYQVFMGIKAGVELAEKHERSLLSIDCNSLMVTDLFDGAPRCSDKKCRDTRYLDYICKRCERYFSGYRGWNRRLLVSLVVELRGKNIKEFTSSWSEAAHYLAKREKKNKRPEVEKKEERTAPYDDKPSDMVPDDFPPELKDFLWRDAFASSRFMAVYVEDPIM